jgi:outer membrane protein, heavy metal efflux system
MTRRLLTVCAAALVMPSLGLAQPWPSPWTTGALSDLSAYVDPVGGTSLEQAIRVALASQPALRAARAEIEVAAGRRQQAALRANPTTTFERREEPGGTDSLTSVGLQLPLELFRRGARVAVADREIEIVRLEVADRERRLAAEVRARYGDVLVALRELTVLDEVVAAARTQLTLVAARAAEGAAPPLDRDLLDVEVRRLLADERLQRGRVETAFIALKRTMGLQPDSPLAVQDTLEGLVKRGDATAAAAAPTEEVIRARPDVRSAEARVSLANAQIGQSRSEGRIDVTVFGTYMRMDAGFPQMGLAAGGTLERVRGVFDYVTGGVMVTVPLFDRRQGAVAAARVARRGGPRGTGGHRRGPQ